MLQCFLASARRPLLGNNIRFPKEAKPRHVASFSKAVKAHHPRSSSIKLRKSRMSRRALQIYPTVSNWEGNLSNNVQELLSDIFQAVPITQSSSSSSPNVSSSVRTSSSNSSLSTPEARLSRNRLLIVVLTCCRIAISP